MSARKAAVLAVLGVLLGLCIPVALVGANTGAVAKGGPNCTVKPNHPRCQTPTPTPTPTPTVTPTPPASGTCDPDTALYDWGSLDAAQDINGASGFGPYYLTEDQWNDDRLNQRTVFCAKADNTLYWFAEALTPGTFDGAVKSYPNAHWDFHNWGTGAEPLVSSFTSLRSRFTHISPTDCTGCSFDWAQEIWLNQYNVEVMVWTDYVYQHPGFIAPKVDMVTLNGHTWEVYRFVPGGTGLSRDGYIVFLPAATDKITTADWDILAFISYVRGKGWAGANPTVASIQYGVEICETGGVARRFDVTDFAVTSS